MGPVLVGTTMDFISEVGFLLAAGFIPVTTSEFAVTARRAHRERVENVERNEKPAPTDD